MAEKPVCAVEGCGKPFSAKGYCSSHYSRWKRHGDPLKGNATGRGETLAWLDRHAQHGSDECLIWPFARSSNGYAVTSRGGRAIQAHRVMCEIAHGTSPARGLVVAHSCGNGQSGCVNPKHLRWATNSENHQDALRHGTHSSIDHYGSGHPGAKIDEVMAKEIKLQLAAGIGSSAIARTLGISIHVVRNIKYNGTWSHV